MSPSKKASPASLQDSKQLRNAGIDLLRGLSIFLVVVHHVGLRIPLKQGILATIFPNWLLHALIHNGYEAVFIFFVISGFLITMNALTRWGPLQSIDLFAFYRRRASRILPLLLILVAILSLLHLMDVNHYIITRPNQSLRRAITSALGLHLNWYEGKTGYLPANWDVLWSLSIEEVFYLGFPIACILARRNWILVSLLTLIALSLPESRAALAGNAIWQHKAYLPGMAGIASGILGAIFAFYAKVRGQLLRLTLKLIGIAGIVSVLCFENQLWPLLGNGTLLLLTFSTTCLLIYFHRFKFNSALSRLPVMVWLRSCGRLSYEIYLSHMFVVWVVIDIFKACGSSMKWGILWYFPSVLFSWLLGWAIARYISIPAEKALRNYGTPADAKANMGLENDLLKRSPTFPKRALCGKAQIGANRCRDP